MRDILPSLVYDRIRDRYLAAVAEAEMKFKYNQADEDSLTGALGSAITMEPTLFLVEDARFIVEVSYMRVGGKGPNSLEKRLGADGLFQIRVTDQSGRVTHQKALPFQAKKRWTRANQRVVKQARDIAREFGQGVVIDYAPHGYSSCSVGDVIESNGNPKVLREGQRLKPLGSLLADDFLECTAGVPGLFYDSETLVMTNPRDSSGLKGFTDRPEHVVTTSIGRLPR